MKVKEEITKTVCDVCKKEGLYYDICAVCGLEICNFCNSNSSLPIPPVCKECSTPDMRSRLLKEQNEFFEIQREKLNDLFN